MTGFWSHRKTAKLRGMIGDDALWLPLRLWSYAAENQPDGCFEQYSACELAMLLGYSKDATSMLEALQQAGFMDAMSIHGWEDHNDFHKKFSERAKKAAEARWSKPSPQTPLPKGKRKDIDREQALLEHAPSISSDPSELEVLHSKLEEMDLMEMWSDFKSSRKSKKKPMTELAELLFLRKLLSKPSRSRRGLEMALERGWSGFEWEWVDKDLKKTNANGNGQKEVWVPVETPEYPSLEEVANRHLQ